MIELLILGLATYGTAKLVAEYDGPFDLLYSMRNKRWLSMLTCTVCCATWIAILFSIIFWLGGVWLLLPLALAGAVILIEDITCK